MYRIYVDGGGNDKVPCYFSFKIYPNENTGVKPVLQMNRFLLRNLTQDIVPEGCGILDHLGKETSNIAEYAGHYYSLKRLYDSFGPQPVKLYQDSQLVLSQIYGGIDSKTGKPTGKRWACNYEYLSSWRQAIFEILWQGIEIQWVRRDIIVAQLGH